MHKNYPIFYCYLPKFAEERLLVENVELGFSSMALYDCLYQDGELIGRMFRNAQECVGALLTEEHDNYATLPATSIYRDFDERTFERDLSGRLVEPQFQLVRKYMATAEDLSDEVGIIDRFLDKYIDSKKRFTGEALMELCSDMRMPKPCAMSYTVNLEEYITSSDCVHTRDETLDMVLKYYSFTDAEQASIRKCVEPHVYEPDAFLESLKSCLAKNVSGANRYMIFHLYKIESLSDLFFATLQEAVQAKKFIINRCRYCAKWFITNKRINEKYCDPICEENWDHLNNKHRSMYKGIHNYLSTYCTNKELNDFMRDYTDRKDKVSDASDLRELIAWLKVFRDNIRAGNHTE